MLENGIVAAEVHVAAGVMFDVLVLAGGQATRLAPLCGEAPKAVMPVCHMPLIWHCLRPWVEKGVRTFFICVSQSESPDIMDKLRRHMPGIQFIDVVMLHSGGTDENEDDSEDVDGRASNTSDAVKRYLEVKAGLLPKSEGRTRDVLLLSCDTLIPGVDIQPFISHFYTSRASVSVMLAKPNAAACPPPMAAAKKGGKGKGGHGEEQKIQTLESLAEPVWTFTTSEASSDEGSNKKPLAAAVGAAANNGADLPEHLRLHYIDEELPDDVSAGFVARRPNMTIRHDLIDIHVYLVRDWVARYVAETAGPDRRLQRDVIPLLAKSQFWSYNANEERCVGPDAKLAFEKKVPTHWSLSCESARSIRSLNSMQITSPPSWDTLRVVCTVYSESKDQRLVRVNTKEKYLAVAHECTDFLAATAAAGPAALPLPIVGRQVIDAAKDYWQKLLGRNTLEFLPSRVKCSLLRSLPPHEKVNISRSIIGQNVVFGTDVVIENSVVMDGAEIGNGTVVRNSVVCSRCVVAEGADITNAFEADQFS